MILALLLQLGGCPAPVLQHRIDSLATSVDGRVGIALRLDPGAAMLSVRGAEHFPMQSVYKLPIVMATLARVDRNELGLNQPVTVTRGQLVPMIHSPIRDAHPNGVTMPLREIMRYAIVESDGTASDVLLGFVPPATVTLYLNELGVSDLIVATSERDMTQGDSVQYRNWTTPTAAVELLERLENGQGLSAASQALLRTWLVQSTPGAMRLKRWLPRGTEVAHKTGTSNTSNGFTAATNDIGIITLPDGRRILAAVFVSDSKGSEGAREEVIAQVGLAAWHCATAGRP